MSRKQSEAMVLRWQNPDYKKRLSVCKQKERNPAWKGGKTSLEKKYGISILDYDRMYQIQGGSCPICKRHQTELKAKLNVDHNHQTGFVRGLLCNSCNQALGAFKDNIDTLQNAIDYLKMQSK